MEIVKLHNKEGIIKNLKEYNSINQWYLTKLNDLPINILDSDQLDAYNELIYRVALFSRLNDMKIDELTMNKEAYISFNQYYLIKFTIEVNKVKSIFENNKIYNAKVVNKRIILETIYSVKVNILPTTNVLEENGIYMLYENGVIKDKIIISIAKNSKLVDSYVKIGTIIEGYDNIKHIIDNKIYIYEFSTGLY
jgi:hypothetical protein